MLSITLFILRGGLHLAGVRWRDNPRLRVAPHPVNTALLAAALGLTVRLQQYPFSTNWLTAKLVMLVIYMLLGREGLRPGRSRQYNAAFFLAALLAVAAVVAISTTHSARVL